MFPFNLTEPRCRLESGLRAPTLSNWAVPINSCDSCVGTVVKTSVGIERSQKPQRYTSTRSDCRWDSCWLLGQSEAGMSWQRIPTWHVKCPHGCIHFISHRHEYIMKLWKIAHLCSQADVFTSITVSDQHSSTQRYSFEIFPSEKFKAEYVLHLCLTNYLYY